jgi:enamine deaminase RidA (YjgF/YER057c/UK114 family)
LCSSQLFWDLSSKETSRSPVAFQKEACHIDRMTIKHLSFLAVVLIGSLTASAQKTKRIPLPASQNPSNADLPISTAVWAGDTLSVSGWLDPDMKTHTDITSQTVGLLTDIQEFLASQKLTMGDVVKMNMYLGADPAKDGKSGFAGMMAGYSQFFGTRNQPNKPARTTLQVVLPAASRGALIEIDLVAVRP